jgi:hypothetical protein
MTRILLLVLATAAGLCAQTATLSGVVRDTSQSAMAGAVVELHNEDTGADRSVTTAIDGVYSLTLLPPAHYTLSVRANGFQTASRTGLRLDSGTVRLDFVLQPGTVGQSVTVSAESNVLGTDASGVSTVIDRQLIQNVPLNGRSFQSLISLTPGVVMTKATFGEQGQFSVNGQRANANYFTIDGVSANIGVSAGLTLVQSSSGSLPGLAATGGTNTLVSVEALEQFQIETSGAAPEYGRMPGAQILILTRAGTNQFHGALFDFFRNDTLDASDWFANANSLPKPQLRQNDFGGVFGGPLTRDRTFFFLSYEGLRLHQPQVLATDVPSVSTRQTACAGCKTFLNAFPLPNRSGGRLGFAPFVAGFSDVSSLDAASLRLDHRFGTRLSLFGRYNYAPSSYTARQFMLSNPIDTTALTETLTSGATLLLSPHMVNDLRLNWSHSTAASFARLDSFGGATPFAPALFFPTTVDPASAFGGYALSGGTNSSFYIGKNVANTQRQWNVVDTFALSAGAHLVKLGADWRSLATLNNPRAYDLMAAFVATNGAVNGVPAQITIGAQERITDYFQNLSLFAQDTWKLAPHLTATYGLRWEFNPPPTASLPLYTLRAMQLAPRGTPLYAASYGSFAPRLGLAFQPTSWTTLRTGFGVYYDLGAGLIGQAAAGFPYFRQRVLPTGTAFPPPAVLAQPLPFTITSIYGAQAGLRLPLTYEWSLSVEQRLGATRQLSIAWIGAAGRHLLRQIYYVNPTPDISTGYLLTNAAFSDFESMQAPFQQRLVHGIFALVSYTLGKSLDNVSTESALNLAAIQLNPHNDRGSSDFDIRQTLSAAFTYSFRNWGLDGVWIARSATPVDVTYSRDVGFGLTSLRADLVSGVPLYVDDPGAAGGRRFNPEAFTIPLAFPGRQGTLGRNMLRGFPLAQLNFTLRREFPIHERLRLQLRAELFNALNHPAFADPTGSLFATEFGESTQMLGRSLGRGGANGGLNPLYQVGGPRSIQLALRLVF